jgi:hypothetical protein
VSHPLVIGEPILPENQTIHFPSCLGSFALSAAKILFPSCLSFLLVKPEENARIYVMKTVKPKPETCQPKPAPPAPLFGHIKPLPQSLSLEEARLQFLQNNRLASSRKRP